MKLKLWSWILVVLCALLASKTVVADVAAETNNESAVVAEVIQDKLVDTPVGVVPSDDKNNEKAPAKDDDIEPDNTQEKETAKENKEALALEALINAEVIKEPGMQRLARQLNRFHNYQLVRSNPVYRNNNAGMRRVSDDFSDQDEEDDAIAEERAVRRRKRVRRRNTKNKIKRTHRNKHVANRRKSSRRKSSNKNSVRRKNVKKAKSKRRRNKKNKNTRLVNGGGGGNRKNVKRRGSSSSSNKRRTNRNKGSRNQKRKSSSKRKSNKRRKSKKDPTLARKQNDQIPEVESDNLDVAQDVAAASDA